MTSHSAYASTNKTKIVRIETDFFYPGRTRFVGSQMLMRDKRSTTSVALPVRAETGGRVPEGEAWNVKSIFRLVVMASYYN